MNDAELFMVTVIVPDMDDAIAHYTRDWGFTLAQDSRHASGHRWVELAIGEGARIRLAEAKSAEESSVIGRQTAQSVAFFLRIGNFDQTISDWVATRIKILEPPRNEAYGRVAVVADTYGNRWDVFDKDYAAST